MNTIIQRISASFAALLIAVLSLAISTPMSATAHASMTSPADMDHATHVSHVVQSSSNDTTVAHVGNMSCASLCQANATVRPDSIPPSSEKEEDDEYDDFLEDAVVVSPCQQKRITYDSYTPRQPKVPLYLKHCSLII